MAPNADGRKFRGVLPALVTPFAEDEKVDYEAYKWLINQQILGGVNGIVPCGTTGESPTLGFDEHVSVMEAAVKFAAGRVPVIAGTGSNSTAEAIELTKAAKDCGAAAVLVVFPYYNKPMDEGILRYYRRIAEIGLPVILYDIPGRTGKQIPLEVLLQLMRERMIAGLKWASGDFKQLMAVIQAAPETFAVLSGDDQLTFPLMALGGHGVVSVLSNLLPEEMSRLIVNAAAGRWEEARCQHYKYLRLMLAMFGETNPQPVKTSLAMKYPDIFSENFREPMVPMEKGTKAKLWATLEEYGLVSGKLV